MQKIFFNNFILIIFSIILVLPFKIANAESLDNLRDQRSIVQQKLEKLNQEIRSIQTQLSINKSQANSLKNEINAYDGQIRSTRLAIDAKSTQIEDKELQIKEIQLQLSKRDAELKKNRQLLAMMITELNGLGDSSALKLIVEAKNFSDFYDQAEYVSKVNDKVTQIVKNVKVIKTKLVEQEKSLEEELGRLNQLKSDLEVSRSVLESQARNKQELLSATKGKEKEYQKLYQESKKAEDELEEEIANLEATIRKQIGDRDLQVSKGALIMPMKGVVTQKYGNTGFRALGYSFHNGIDVAAPAGEPIYAAQDGIVTHCDSGKAAYGNWCTVRHKIKTKSGAEKEIVSLYAHMRSYVVKNGQRVSLGDLIGYEGNTGNTTRLLYGPHRGYHLHLTIFDAEGFNVATGKYSSKYGSYSIPYGYTYNPFDFIQ